jgi:hypothetical protein
MRGTEAVRLPPKVYDVLVALVGNQVESSTAPNLERSIRRYFTRARRPYDGAGCAVNPVCALPIPSSKFLDGSFENAKHG